MTTFRTGDDYFHKAAMYSLLADYYKYQDPNLHVKYYHKHLRNLRKAIQFMHDGHPITRPGSGEARLRFLHASPDVDKVDIYINGSRVLRDFDYKNSCSHMQLPPGRYQIDIYPAGQSVSTVISKKITVAPGKIYTSAVIGISPKLRLLTFSDQPYTPAGETKARFIHLCPDAPAVDLAVKDRDVIFPDVSFRQATGYLGMMPMTVSLEARTSGTDEAILVIPELKLQPNIAYTIFAVGTVEGKRPLEAILLQE